MEKISELVNNLPNEFFLEQAKGLKALIQLSVSGEGGGNWGIEVDDGNITIKEGLAIEPRLTIKTSAQNASKLLQGKLNPLSAFMTGKIKLSGDLALAMKLIDLLKNAGLGK